MKLPIFMDYHSTTPVDPKVLEEMIPYFTQDFGKRGREAVRRLLSEAHTAGIIPSPEIEFV